MAFNLLADCLIWPSHKIKLGEEKSKQADQKLNKFKKMKFKNFSAGQSNKLTSEVLRIEESQSNETKESLKSTLLDLNEACKLLGVSKRTCQNFRDQRRISFHQVGRKIFFKTSDIEEFLDRHHIKANYQKGGAAC